MPRIKNKTFTYAVVSIRSDVVYLEPRNAEIFAIAISLLAPELPGRALVNDMDLAARLT